MKTFTVTLNDAWSINYIIPLITYSRGRMKVLDEEGLRNGSCEYLELIEKQFEKMLEPGIP